MDTSSAGARLWDTLAPLFAALVNSYLKLDPDARAELAGEGEAAIGIEVLDVAFSFCVMLRAGDIAFTRTCPELPNAWIRGRPVALATMVLRGQTGEDVIIEGDAELAARFHRVLKSVKIDWEEWLSRLSGDAIAHQTGESVRAFQHWLKNTHRSLEMDLSEYLTEESGTLPTRGEIERFMDEVDALRSDTDRLEARIARLEAQRKNQSPT